MKIDVSSTHREPFNERYGSTIDTKAFQRSDFNGGEDRDISAYR